MEHIGNFQIVINMINKQTGVNLSCIQMMKGPKNFL